MIRRKAVMTRLWQRMAAIFGNLWESNYGPVGGQTFATWMDGLGCYTEDQLGNGIAQCRNWNSAFPPNMGQFSKLCLDTLKPTYTDRRIEQERKQGKSMGMMEHLSRHATKPTAQRELERLQRILAGEDVESRRESFDNLGLAKRMGGFK